MKTLRSTRNDEEPFFALGVILLCGATKYCRIIGEFRVGFWGPNLRSRIQVYLTKAANVLKIKEISPQKDRVFTY